MAEVKRIEVDIGAALQTLEEHPELGAAIMKQIGAAVPSLVPVKRLTPTAKLPTYGSAGAAGMDFYADLGWGEEVQLYPGQRHLFPTGISMAIPEGFYLDLDPRSGLAYKHGIHVLAGIIDSDYRGDIGVILLNTGTEKFSVRHGDRIAQGIVKPVMQATLVEVLELPTTGRGSGGFGSTGR